MATLPVIPEVVCQILIAADTIYHLYMAQSGELKQFFLQRARLCLEATGGQGVAHSSNVWERATTVSTATLSAPLGSQQGGAAAPPAATADSGQSQELIPLKHKVTIREFNRLNAPWGLKL
ncbi:hypothetical protein HUJ05_001994 [Dendroctonus ponderosae]|nr:hypothetical protein HUJ05_001994 [Dendroctonus ponderosae]